MNLETYLDWNDKIAKYFFNNNNANKKVFLSVEKELITEIAKTDRKTFEDFIQAIKQGPNWFSDSNQKVAQRAYNTFKDWRNRNLTYPPYIAYLALFVLAVNYNNEGSAFHENAYYDRLRHILGESDASGQYPSFNKMIDLWDDLEKWSLEEKKSEWGEFSPGIYGQKIHIGIPIYQVILTKEDKCKLPEFFWKMGWDSDSSPNDKELLESIKKYGKEFFSKKTLKKVEDNNFSDILLERILDQLKYYDEDESASEGTISESEKRGHIILCLDDIDQISGIVKVYFRCKRFKGIPDEFMLKNENIEELKIESSISNVSKPIKNCPIVDWKKDFILKNEKYRFQYKGNKYKVFEKGRKLGLNGWIETRKAPLKEKFYLATDRELSSKVIKWGTNACEEFNELGNIGELPQNWKLFEIKGVNNDYIKENIPSISMEKKLRIHLLNGIKVSQSDKFFNFAMPEINIEVGFQKLNVICKEAKLIKKDSGHFVLPEDIPKNEWISIKSESEDNNQKTKKKVMIVEENLKKASEYSTKYTLNCWGELKDRASTDSHLFLDRACNSDIKNEELNPTLFPYFSCDLNKKIYLIGNSPGEISAWSSKSDLKWPPSWLISFKNHKTATAYRLRKTSQNALILERRRKLSKKERYWKKIVWTQRKKVKAEIGSSKEWKLYLKEVEKCIKI